MQRIMIIALALLCMIPAAAENVSTADSLYNKKQYEEALRVYQDVQKEGLTSAPMLYNMGNTAVKCDHYGEAMVAYQKAQSMDPGNSRIRNNIEYLQQKIFDRNNAKLGGRKGDVTPDEPSGLSALWYNITGCVNPNLWGTLAFGFFVLLLAGVLCYFLSGNVLVRKIGFFSAIGCVALTIIFGCFTVGARNHWANRQICVVTAFESTPLPKPDKEEKSTLTPLVAGTLLSTPETDTPTPEGWVFVRLNATTAGYVPAEEVTVIK